MNQTTNATPVTPVKEGDNITIIGRRWFDRINGNTYFSSTAIINEKEVVNIPYEYGYGDQYLWAAYRELEKKGYLTDVEHYNNGGMESFWSYCERKGITKYNSVTDVNRKKDL